MSTMDRFRLILLPRRSPSSSRRRGRPACGDMLHCHCSCCASSDWLLYCSWAVVSAALLGLMLLSPDGPNLVVLTCPAAALEQLSATCSSSVRASSS
uniref:Uncharacterized protein n=1 Tax=Arundo donax TaxID=35708 RepID=A0A0A9GRQ4_ARUDO